jgi:pimeloyl-ACP methyl ester carboxylesterase
MTHLRIGGADLYAEVAGEGEPVLLLHGGFCSLESLRAQSDAEPEADRDSIPPAHSLLIAASIPGAQLCIVPGTTHDLLAERPELISELLRSFPTRSAAAATRSTELRPGPS